VFRALLKDAIADFYLKTYKAPLIFPPEKDKEKAEPVVREVTTVTPYPDSASAKIAYKVLVYSDQANPQVKDRSVFEVYIREEGSKQAAIVFQRPLNPTNVDALAKSINACLGTLDISGQAGANRYLYRKAKGLEK
jgi:hypothetical protein